MELEEQVIVKVTLPSKKKRKEPGYWNIEDGKHHGVKASIEKCLVTGKEVWHRGDMIVYHITPVWPRTDLTPEQHAELGLLRVHVSMYGAALFMAVKDVKGRSVGE